MAAIRGVRIPSVSTPTTPSERKQSARHGGKQQGHLVLVAVRYCAPMTENPHPPPFVTADPVRAALMDLLDQLDLVNVGERTWNELYRNAQHYRRALAVPEERRPIDVFFDEDRDEHNDGSDDAAR